MKKFSELNEALGEMDLWNSEHRDELLENITQAIEMFFDKVDKSGITYDVIENEDDDIAIEKFIAEISHMAFQKAYLEKIDDDKEIGTYTDFEELPEN